ncbi:MAG: SIS domain-containing protein [Clostridia bacterium]|nr:SIS domain-containing protein [Clostridia bacterium]
MNISNEYLKKLSALIDEVAEKEEKNIDAAIKACFESLKNGKMLYTFGTGHSHLLAEEIFYRAGGLVRVYPILDEGLMLHAGAAKSTTLERLEGYAEVLAEHYALEEGSTLLIFSNSGRNAVTVEMVLEAKKRGLTVIAITNMTHTSASASRHSSGKKLCDVADIVIDNHGCYGDASMEIGELRVSPTSTSVGAAILQAIVCGVVKTASEEGVDIEVFSSSNIDGGDAINQAHINNFTKKIRPLW